MKHSAQDRHYIEVEADAFFKRNFAGKPAPPLRRPKQEIADQLEKAGVRPKRVLEYGCNYGDLLNHLVTQGGAEQAVGVDASKMALDFGRSLYGAEKLRWVQGTIANNEVNDDPAAVGSFDLVVIDDVFGWVSRETVLQSVTNIDDMVGDGGFLFIRDYDPDYRMKNPNHHVREGFVFSFKVPGSHAALFLATGIYEVAARRVFMDQSAMSGKYMSSRVFESRWADTILKKSRAGYFLDNNALAKQPA